MLKEDIVWDTIQMIHLTEAGKENVDNVVWIL